MGAVSWLQLILVARFDADKTLTHLEPSLSYKDFSNVDMVIEAIFEDIKVKHAVLKEVEQVETCFLFVYSESFSSTFIAMHMSLVARCAGLVSGFPNLLD